MMPMESALRCLSSRNQDLQKLKRHHIKNGGNLEPSSGQIPRPHRRHRFGHPVKSHHLRSCRWFACQMPIAAQQRSLTKEKNLLLEHIGTILNHQHPQFQEAKSHVSSFHDIYHALLFHKLAPAHPDWVYTMCTLFWLSRAPKSIGEFPNPAFIFTAMTRLASKWSLQHSAALEPKELWKHQDSIRKQET